MTYQVMLDQEDDWDGWRAAVRTLVQADVAPEAVSWQVRERQTDSGPHTPETSVATLDEGTLFKASQADLFGRGEIQPSKKPAFSVPKAFVSLARLAILHSDPERFSLLHGLLLRVLQDPRVLKDRSDPRTRKVEAMEHTIRRDMHKMRAFVRFRALEDDKGERFVSWFEPEHHILRANADFFIRRFTTMRWSILTPSLSIHWDGEKLEEGPGASKADAPTSDPIEEIWKGYFASTFNPARLKVDAMMKEMPKKYWKNMPETELISDLIAGAFERERKMLDK